MWYLLKVAFSHGTAIPDSVKQHFTFTARDPEDSFICRGRKVNGCVLLVNFSRNRLNDYSKSSKTLMANIKG